MKAGCDFEVDGGQPRHRPRNGEEAAGPGSGAGGGGSDRKGCGRMGAEAPIRPLTHWTAETGLKGESSRSDDDLLAALAPDVERIRPETVNTVFAVPGPGTEGWLWHAVAANGALRATVWGGYAGRKWFQPSRGDDYATRTTRSFSALRPRRAATGRFDGFRIGGLRSCGMKCAVCRRWEAPFTRASPLKLRGCCPRWDPTQRGIRRPCCGFPTFAVAWRGHGSSGRPK